MAIADTMEHLMLITDLMAILKTFSLWSMARSWQQLRPQ